MLIKVSIHTQCHTLDVACVDAEVTVTSGI